MTVPTIEFYATQWALFPSHTEAIDFRLKATPPVAANVAMVVYMSGINAKTLTKVGEYTLDNIPSTAPIAKILVPIKASKRYTFVLHGNAHNLFPDDESVSVGFQAFANGVRIDSYGQKSSVNNRVAEIIGIFNCRRG